MVIIIWCALLKNSTPADHRHKPILPDLSAAVMWHFELVPFAEASWDLAMAIKVRPCPYRGSHRKKKQCWIVEWEKQSTKQKIEQHCEHPCCNCRTKVIFWFHLLAPTTIQTMLILQPMSQVQSKWYVQITDETEHYAMRENRGGLQQCDRQWTDSSVRALVRI